MGLVATATGLSMFDEFNCGYITYHRFIEELVKVAYGQLPTTDFQWGLELA